MREIKRLLAVQIAENDSEPDTIFFADELDALHRLAHNLAGSGATYGYARLSELAHEVEDIIQQLIDAKALPQPDQLATVESFIDSMETAVHDDEKTLTPEPSAHLLTAHSPWDGSGQRVIYLIEDDNDLAEDLALQVGHFGYTVRIFNNTTALRDAIGKEPPAAIIADVILPEGANASFEAAKDIHLVTDGRVPILFLSARSDMEARLQAVRAGGHAYFTKPVDIGDIIDKLDTLTAHEAPSPYRILIVDDEGSLASFYAWTLQQAGMSTMVVTDPMEIMQTLVDFRPDLILMDVYMPTCTGLEMAKVIRQQEDYVSIPIVFLSAETDIEKQLAAMNSGGDDFLTKPIQPDHLISSVSTRAQRSRTLRSFMIRDSLTGLLNHTTTKEQLSIEVMRARRASGKVSFAMIDIDSFKSVNDRFGHLIGDRVIKSLARLLQQRLRKTDIIGRYGGEEFAAILSNTDGETALKVLDEIRVGFSQIHHRTRDFDFNVTFSCGIAEFPDFPDPARLGDAADKALYSAKRAGRNQVILAQKTGVL
jgi:diguanylate cyclase (GGDEF)-like protein